MKLVENKRILNIIYTQNVDCLEIKAGISQEKIVFAHGNRNEANCVICKSKISVHEMKNAIEMKQVYYCKKCYGPCKYSVVFFGEGISEDFFNKRQVNYYIFRN